MINNLYNKQTIVWIYPHLKFWMGGSKFLFEVTKRLNRQFHLIIICNLGNKTIINKFENSGITVITTSRISTNSIIYWFLFPIFFVYDFICYAKFLLKGDYNIASLYPSNLIVALFSKLFNKKYYYFCYEPFPFFHNQEVIDSYPKIKSLLFKLLSKLYGWTDIWATRNSYKIFTFDQTKSKMIKKVYHKSSIVTKIGVDTDHFRNYKHNYVRNKYKNRIIITHSTDYTPSKKTDIVIQVIKQLSKKYPQVLLIITSTSPNSPEKQKLEIIVKKLGIIKNVLFKGFVSEKDLPYYYSASLCYITLATNYIYSTNMPVKECMACETPVIRYASTNDDVKNCISGFLANNLDLQQIADKVIYLIKNPEERIKMGQAGRQTVKKYFNWSSVTKHITDNL